MNLLEHTQQRRLYWAGLVLNFSLYSFNALATVVMAALIGVKWEALTGQEKFMIAVSVAANWTGMVLIFTKRGMSRLAQGKLPIETGDTDHIRK